MSLTTRCPSCGTAFRVQPAQLSARGGTSIHYLEQKLAEESMKKK